MDAGISGTPDLGAIELRRGSDPAVGGQLPRAAVEPCQVAKYPCPASLLDNFWPPGPTGARLRACWLREHVHDLEHRHRGLDRGQHTGDEEVKSTDPICIPSTMSRSPPSWAPG